MTSLNYTTVPKAQARIVQLDAYIARLQADMTAHGLAVPPPPPPSSAAPPPHPAVIETALGLDLARMAKSVLSTATEEEIMRITLIPREGGAPFSIEVRPGQPFLPTVQDALEDPRAQAWHGGDEITDSEGTFGEYGIEDGARITLAANTEPTPQEVAEEFVACNPGNPKVTVNELLNGEEVYEDGNKPRLTRNADGSVKDWYFSEMGLVALPDSICSLRISGNLGLARNNLSTLPADFASITVGGNLRLDYNNLSTLPADFGSITVGGDLFLRGNTLSTLPADFASITVGGDLYLGGNRLLSTPESFPNVGGEIYR